jgi:DNA polymerase I
LTSSSSPTNHPTFILVDGHSLAFRSYYAYAKGKDGGLKTKTGIPTSVSFGFLKSLLEVMESQQPEAIAVAFDLSTPTFRHEADESYKADRKETPEDFIPDLKNLQELLAGLNIKIFTKEGFEADDILGTLAEKASGAGYEVKILSGDRDLFQLIDLEKRIKVLYLTQTAYKKSDTGPVEFGPEEVKEKLGILPSQVVDYKALCGDKSDNIPGVDGIGEKTAVKLLTTYGNLDQIYASITEIKGANQKKLIDGKSNADHSRYMATIVTDVEVEVDFNSCKLAGFDVDSLKPILEKLEFNYFLKKINALQEKFGGVVVEISTAQIATKSDSLVVNEDQDLWFYSQEETDASIQERKEDLNSSIIQPIIVDTPEKLADLVKILEKCTNFEKPIAWDTETTSLEPRDAKLVGIGCCWGTEVGETAYIPTGHIQGNNLDKGTVFASLRPILESAKYPKIFQNTKFDRLIFRAQGIELKGVIFDPMLASYVLNPDNSHNLTDLAIRYLGITLKNYEDLVPKGKNIGDVEISFVAYYCCLQVHATYQLFEVLQKEFENKPELLKLLNEVELPLEPVLAEMEYTGIRIDSDYLGKLSQKLELHLKEIEKNAYAAAGEEFNLASPKQLGELLFDKLNLDRRKSRKIKTGYSTDAGVLEKLQGDHPVVDAIIENRTLSKLKSTYVDALPKLVRADTQRVHTDFNQVATSTGRLSSSNPNLQNIPIRTAFSRQIRKAFLPQSGWLIVAADYSQIELRILAHLSEEPTLIRAYLENQDIHAVTAQLVFEKENITSDERRFAKTINFGVIYGMGAQKFSRETGVTVTDAKKFIERFNQRYAKVFEYLEKVKKQAIANGYVETILGRRRHINLTSNNLLNLRGANINDIDLDKYKNLSAYDAGLLRAAANAPIQGSSADIIKKAMIGISELLKKYQARLLLQVHDELIFEVPPEELQKLQRDVKSVMENAVSLRVPLLVEINAGNNWMEAK